jgi:hypothetical protein
MAALGEQPLGDRAELLAEVSHRRVERAARGIGALTTKLCQPIFDLAIQHSDPGCVSCLICGVPMS